MGMAETLRRVRRQPPSETDRLTGMLRDEPAVGLAHLVRFAETLDERMPSAEARLGALESLRGGWRAAVGRTVQGLRNRPIPFEREELAAFQRTALALRAVRDATDRVHADLRAAQPDAPASPRALLALARALDAQSRLLTAACRLRVALPRDDWDALCRLALPLSQAGALDQTFPEAGVEAARTGTPRAVFVLPLLLRLLEPLGLSSQALDLADAIARAGAPRTGLAIDLDGLPHVGRDGPALVLSMRHAVRLDTREPLGWLARCVRRLGEGAAPAALGLATPMAPGAVAALIGQLDAAWAPGHVPTPLVRPPIPHARLLAGLPRRLPGAGRVETETARRSVGPAGDSPYVYGRGTALAGIVPSPSQSVDAMPSPSPAAAHVVPDLAAPPVPPVGPCPSTATGPRAGRGHGDGRIDGPAAPPVATASASGPATLASGSAEREVESEAARSVLGTLGETVAWRGQDARRSVFTRTEASPRLRLGQLVAVLPSRPAGALRRGAGPRPGSGPGGAMLGRVVSLAQTGAADGREPYSHDVGVAFWPGSPVPVRVRLDDRNAFEDAWWLPAGDGRSASLVLRRDRFERPGDVLERGPDFDRVEVTPIG
jgi:hypothetical protein